MSHIQLTKGHYFLQKKTAIKPTDAGQPTLGKKNYRFARPN